MENIFIIKCVAVAFATGISDLFWTLYITNAQEHNKWKAAFYSSCIILVGSFSVVEYVNDRRLVIPAAIGAFMGTFIPLWRRAHKAETNKV